jgi:hypothetical protein
MKWIAIVSLCLAGAAQAQVYRCEEGSQIVYSDAPCTGKGAVMNPDSINGNPFGTPLPIGSRATASPVAPSAVTATSAPPSSASAAAAAGVAAGANVNGAPTAKPNASARDSLLNCVNDSCKGASGAQYRREVSGIGYTRRSDGARCVLREGTLECP